MTRFDNRAPDSLRAVNIIEDFVSCADASILIEVGRTRVLCNATIEEKVPKWFRDRKGGWVTAEYSLLPRSTDIRVRRERGTVSGRTQEIQRLIGRSLRAVCDLSALGENTILIDCDVLEADGGTRTASVVGGFMAMVKAVRHLSQRGRLKGRVIRSWLAATSVGIVNEEPLLDLCYSEDTVADVDMNIVMTDKEEFVEIQGTGEESTFNRNQLDLLLALAAKGCTDLIELQQSILGDELP